MSLSNMTDRFERVIESLTGRSIFIAVFVIIAVAVRFYYATGFEHPGHGDMAYYMHLAENIAEGRGFVIDYIWHFLYDHPDLTHPANDYWQPFTSIIISAFFIIGGKSLLMAIIPSILFAVLLSLITYQIGLTLFKHKLVALYASVVILFIPGIFKYSILTDSTIYYAVFVSMGLLALIKTSENIKLYLLAAIMAGLAHFTRQDGVLFMLVVLLTIMISSHSLKMKLQILLLSFFTYLITLSPLLISNIKYFGTPLVSSSTQTLFLKSYEDLYSLPDKLTLSNYLKMGYSHIIFYKLKMLIYNTYLAFIALNKVLLPFTAVGIFYPFYLLLNKDKRQAILPLILFGILLLLFHSIAATVVSEYGSYVRSEMALIPFIIVFGIHAIFTLINSKTISRLIILVVLVVAAVSSLHDSNVLVKSHRASFIWLGEFEQIIENDHDTGEEIIVMTRAPWELTYSTGYRSIQIPNDSIDVIYQTAIKYKVNYLLLPAPREDLQPIYDQTVIDGRFVYLDNIEGTKYKIFKIKQP